MENKPVKACPLCKSVNDAAVLYCVNCGIPLDAIVTGSATMETIQRSARRKADKIDPKDIVLESVPETGLGIYIDRYDHPNLITRKSEFYLGRKTEISDVNLIDLNPFQAVEMGISRRHVKIYQIGDGYRCMDLGSTNGSWIDNLRLVPKVAYSISTRTHLRLGRLDLILAYRKTSGGSRGAP